VKSFDFVLSTHFLLLLLLLPYVDKIPIKIPLCHQRFSIWNLRQTGVAMVMNVSHSCNNNLEYIFFNCSVLLCASQVGTSVDKCITIGHDLAMQHCATRTAQGD